MKQHIIASKIQHFLFFFFVIVTVKQSNNKKSVKILTEVESVSEI